MNLVGTLKNQTDLLFNIALFVFIAQLFLLTEYVRGIMVLTLGWGNINPLRLFTVGIPAFLVINKCFKERHFATPYLKWFGLVFLGFIIMESLPCRKIESSYSFLDMIPLAGQLLGRPEPAYSFAKEQLFLYVFFLILINFGINKKVFYRIIDYSLIACISVCVLTYLGYIGLIDVGTDFRIYQFFKSIQPEPSLYYVHNISYVSVFSILFLIIKQRHEKKFSKTYIVRDFIIISLATFITVAHASRGAAIDLVILVPYYLVMLWRGCNSRFIKGFLCFLLFLCILVSVHLAPKLALSHRRIERFGSPDQPTRLDNLINTAINFNNHPLIGVGFENAAKTDYAHGSRSNNQFMQILAACGVFYFLIFFSYYFRLYAGRLSSLIRPEVCLSFLMALCHSMLLRPTSVFPVFAYIALYFYSCDHREVSKLPSNFIIRNGNSNMS